MTASVPRDPFAVAAGRVDPDGTAAPRLVPTPLALVATTPPPDLLPQPPELDAADPPARDAEARDATDDELDPERPFRPLTRELLRRHQPPEARAPKHDHLVPRFSRLANSAVTFGPVGRVVVTLVLVAIPAFLLWVSLVWIVFDGIYLFFLLPALRDVWQPVRVPHAASGDAGAPAESELIGE